MAFLSQNRAFGRVWSRAGDGWTSADAAGMDAALALPATEVDVPSIEAYEGVEFAAAEG